MRGGGRDRRRRDWTERDGKEVRRRQGGERKEVDAGRGGKGRDGKGWRGRNGKDGREGMVVDAGRGR